MVWPAKAVMTNVVKIVKLVIPFIIKLDVKMRKKAKISGTIYEDICLK